MSARPSPARPLDTIGAFVPHSPPPSAGAAHGPLAGRTFAVKDLFDLAGYVTGGGSPAWLATHAPASNTAVAVQRLLDAGADFVGKTVCDEFFYSITGENAHYGTPRNVRAPGRIPGGSSSGSAAAVAAGLCDFALGSDTGGSVRVPGAFCGLYGLRPSHGRVSLDGAMAMAPSFDTAGWFARNGATLEAIGAVLLEGAAIDVPVTRVGIALDAWAEADPALQSALRAALGRLGAILPAPRPVQLAPHGFEAWRECMRVCQGAEVWQQFGAWVSAVQPQLGPGIRERMAMASALGEEAVIAARAVRARAAAHLEALLPPGHVVLLPTVPFIAPRCGLSYDELQAVRVRVFTLVVAASLSGLPQITLPLASVDDCPVGLSVLGWRHGDEALLRLAQALDAT